MTSRPVALIPAFSGIQTPSSSQGDVSGGRMLVRRLRRIMLCALSLYLSFTIVLSAGERSKGAAQPFNLFIDVTNSHLAEGLDISTRRRLDLAGVPIVVSGKRQNGAAPSIAAGIVGSYDFDFGKHVTMKASGLVSRIHTEGSGILAGGRIGGDTTIKYEQGGSGVLVRPSLYATLQHDVLERMDYDLESKAWHTIGSGVDMTATLGRSWRESELLDADSSETGYGRFGLDIDLFEGSSLGLAYGFSTADGLLASQFRLTHGPTIVTRLAVAPGWRIESGYGLAATERGYTDTDENARRHDLRHRFGLKSSREFSSTTGTKWHLSTTYDYEHTATDDPETVPASHSAMVNFALNF